MTEQQELGSPASSVQVKSRAGHLRFLGAKTLDAGVQLLGVGAFYVIVLVVFSLLAPEFLTLSNGLNILSNISVLGIVALGQAFTIISGGFDLSVSGTVPLAAVSFAELSNRGFPLAVCVVLTVGIGATVGSVNGLIVARFGISPLITTLATLSITTGLAFTINNGVTTTLNDPAAGVLATRVVGSVSWDIILFILLSLLAWALLRLTVPGRMIYALGGNREASRLAGIRVDVMTTVVYALSGALASFAGVIVASQLLAGTATVGTNLALQTIAAVILGGAALTGGTGGIPGTVLGVLLLGTIANGLDLLQVAAFYQQIASGCVLLLAVAFVRLRPLLTRRIRRDDVMDQPATTRR